MTQETLKETSEYKLTLEKTAGQWWLELINRATGKTRIMYFGRKDKALGFFNRMEMPDIIRMYDKLNVPESPMYKAGVM